MPDRILVVPTRRHSGGKKGFDFRSQIKGFVVDGVVERLNAEAVTSSDAQPRMAEADVLFAAARCAGFPQAK